MDLDTFIGMLGFDLKSKAFQDRFKDTPCSKCEKRQCEYITLGVAYTEHPTFDLYCVKCIAERDFGSMITSQVRPSNFFLIRISTGTTGTLE